MRAICLETCTLLILRHLNLFFFTLHYITNSYSRPHHPTHVSWGTDREALDLESRYRVGRWQGRAGYRGGALDQGTNDQRPRKRYYILRCTTKIYTILCLKQVALLSQRGRAMLHTYNLLNSSNKRACSNTFVHVTQVSSTHNNGQKLQENVKSDTRKLLKHLKKKQFKNEKKQHTQNKNTLMLKT